MDEKFSLKDYLFNEKKVTKMAEEISTILPSFDKKSFTKEILAKFPELELKQRITFIAETLSKFLPASYPEAIKVILKSLPPENDSNNTDNDFGDFIYAPYSEFVAKFGLEKQYLKSSLFALHELTRRFSAEDAIRYYINKFPEETFAELAKWSRDSHYHVRRLVTEGARPKLPWSAKIQTPFTKALPLLDNLYFDKTRFVTRSVANHINDISKIDPDAAIATLSHWKKEGKQNEKEMDYIINHSLRTLIKQGYAGAFKLMNYSPDAKVIISDFKIKNEKLKMGESLEFEFTIESAKDENILVDYIIHFQNKRGEMNSKKVFKIKKLKLVKGEKIKIYKRHPLREIMTTRTLYPGQHLVEIQVNGLIVVSKLFRLQN